MHLPRRTKPEAQAQTASPTGALAPELLLMILAHLRNPAADLAIRTSGEIPRVDRALAVSPRICRVWSAAATQELYFAVTLPTVEACARFLRTLKSNPALGAQVRSIALPPCSACTSARHSRPRCQAADIFSEIMCRLTCLKAARVQDAHVSPRAIHAALSRVHELTIDNGYSACLAVRHPQLLYAGSAMPNLRRLNLLGSPWEMPAPADGATYFFPRLHVLSMTAIDAPVTDVSALLHATNNLRDLRLDSVRAFIGPCGSYNVVPLALLAAPVSRSLQSLSLQRMGDSAPLDPLPEVQHLEVDAASSFVDMALPSSISTITVGTPHRDARELCRDAASTNDPFEVAGELLTWIARSNSPRLRCATLYASAPSFESLMAWQQASALISKMLAQTGVSWKLHIVQGYPETVRASEAAKVLPPADPTCGSGWLRRRRLFRHMQKMLRIL
ncbi:hypothetical protein AURDEDRAFT_130869 [Auricularia subglabra TFB-10046 SS5]|nr:hypothetical protein AURDEDRAFT_130869 [Auricularia subglabra TFB-10046 SS5]